MSTRPIVCYVTDRKVAVSADPTAGVLASIRAAVSAGVDWVQIREKDLPARQLLALVQGALSIARGEPPPRNVCVIVNDRLDVAVAAGADGVHLGGESIPAADAVRWCRSGHAPSEFLIGVSCHSIEQARAAETAGANYIFFGPVFDTPAKRVFGAPQGIAKLGEACRAVRIPVIAIGGVNAENGEECIRTGAGGIAAIRLFQEARDSAALRNVVERLHSSGRQG